MDTRTSFPEVASGTSVPADLVETFPVRACRNAARHAVMEEVTATVLNVVVAAAADSSGGACGDACAEVIDAASNSEVATIEVTHEVQIKARCLAIRVQKEAGFPLLDRNNRYGVPSGAMLGLGGLLPILTPGAASLLVNIVRRFLKTAYAPGTALAAQFGSGLEAYPAGSIVRVTPLGFIVKHADDDKALPWYISPKRPSLTPSKLCNVLIVVCISPTRCSIQVKQLTNADTPVPWTLDPAGPAVCHGRVNCLGSGAAGTHTVEMEPGDARLIPTGYALLPMTLSDGAMLCIGAAELLEPSSASAATASLVLTQPTHAIAKRHDSDAMKRAMLAVVAAEPESRAAAITAGNWSRVVGFNDHSYSMAARGLSTTGLFADVPEKPPVQFRSCFAKHNTGMVSPFDLPYFAQACAYQDIQMLHGDAASDASMLTQGKRELLQRIHDHSIRVKAPQVQLHLSVAGALNAEITIGELRKCTGGQLVAGLLDSFPTHDAADSAIVTPIAGAATVHRGADYTDALELSGWPAARVGCSSGTVAIGNHHSPASQHTDSATINVDDMRMEMQDQFDEELVRFGFPLAVPDDPSFSEADADDCYKHAAGRGHLPGAQSASWDLVQVLNLQDQADLTETAAHRQSDSTSTLPEVDIDDEVQINDTQPLLLHIANSPSADPAAVHAGQRRRRDESSADADSCAKSDEATGVNQRRKQARRAEDAIDVYASTGPAAAAASQKSPFSHVSHTANNHNCTTPQDIHEESDRETVPVAACHDGADRSGPPAAQMLEPKHQVSSTPMISVPPTPVAIPDSTLQKLVDIMLRMEARMGRLEARIGALQTTNGRAAQ